MTITEQLQIEAKRVLAREDVKYVIGYKSGTYGCRTAPAFARTEQEIEDFVWSPLCVNNLATYTVMEARLPLPEAQKDHNRKIGVVVKGCDARALVVQFQEHAVSRDELIIIGVPCQGMIDPQKLERRLGSSISPIDIREQGEMYQIVSDGQSYDIPREDLLADACRNCRQPTPLVYDVLLDAPAEQPLPNSYTHRIQELKERTADERWTLWSRHLSRCIRCYACRNVCPICNCEECMGTLTQPAWIRRSVNLSENTAFHTMRAFHMAGRCIECGMCAKACPVNIPLADLYQRVGNDVLELFDYTAGLDAEATPLLSTYSVHDTNAGIL